jgi:hypothetical protein
MNTEKEWNGLSINSALTIEFIEKYIDKPRVWGF